MIDVKVKKDFNLNRIKCDFSKELNEGIDVIALNIQKGIEKGSQFGKPFERNKQSTIDKKGFDHPLKEKGYMMDSGKMIKTKAKRMKQTAILTPGNKMRGKGKNRISNIDVAYYNDKGTNTIPARPFWGISEKAENEIMLRVKARIHQELRSA